MNSSLIQLRAARVISLAILAFSACSRNHPEEEPVQPKKGADKPAAVSSTAAGVLDSRGATRTVSGWAWDPTQPNVAINVDIYEGETLLGTVLADKFRPALPGNGKHAFAYPLPPKLRDGKAHVIAVKITKTNIELKHSPQLLTYAPKGSPGTPAVAKERTNPKGDGSPLVSGEATGVLHAKDKTTTIHGFAWDPTQPDVAIAVDIYEGKTRLGTVLANKERPTLVKITKDNGKHGFSYPFPLALRDGKAHLISVKISGANIELKNSPQSLTYVPSPTKPGKSTPGKSTPGKSTPEKSSTNP
jgi:hypothetical protein